MSENINNPLVPGLSAKRYTPEKISEISRHIIDECRHQSWFFDHMPRIKLTRTTTYKYYRVANLASATAREYYSEVDETYVELTSEETNIANLASSFRMDDDYMRNGDINMLMSFAATGIAELFNEMVIHGKSDAPRDKSYPAVGPGSFDGLHEIIQKKSLHVWKEPLDLTGLGNTETKTDGAVTPGRQTIWLDVNDQLMSRLAELRPAPTFILGNRKLISALTALGRITGTYQRQQNDFGKTIGSIDGISLIPMGNRCARNEEIIPVRKTETKCRDNPDGTGKTLETTAYVGSFGDLAIMGLQLTDDLVEIRMPDMNTSGHDKKVDIEMPIGMAVKSQHACGMFESVCIGHCP